MGKLIIGKIINTRGLKGEMKVDNRSSFIKDRYKPGNIVYLSKDEETFVSKTIVKYSYTKGFIYLTLEGVNDIDEANLYREYYIFCEDEKLNESLIELANSSNSSRSSNVPSPSQILSKISNILLVPSRHGEHLPQDSSQMNSR